MNTKGFSFKWVHEEEGEIVTSYLHLNKQDASIHSLIEMFQQFLRGCEYSEKLVERIQIVDEDWS